MNHLTPFAHPAAEPRRPMPDRILDCFPSGVYALNALLRLLDIVETESVETAAVECALQPRLLINPVFVEQWAATSEKLLMLVMHELHHVLLGHTRLFPRVARVDNLVFDAVINALLCRMFPAPEHTRFFTDYYRDGEFPECLLRPVDGWAPVLPAGPTPKQIELLPPALHARELKELADVYRALYSPVGASYHDLYGALRRLVTEQQAAAVPLLGDHRPESGPGQARGGRQPSEDRPRQAGGAGPLREAETEGNPGDQGKETEGADTTAGEPDRARNFASSSDGFLEDRSPVLFDIVRQIVERWPQPPDPIAGRSLANLLRSEGVQPLCRPSNRATLRRLLRQVGGLDAHYGPHRDWRADPTSILVPMPTFDRRSVVLRALGAPPLLHRSELPLPRRRPSGERVHVYLDVSGSIGNLKGALYGAVLDCREFVHPVVHLFSTVVVDVALKELRQGKCQTTQGTCIDCVAEHLRAHGITQAVLVTDGYVGRPAGTQRETLARARLGVALTPANPNRGDLEEVADYWALLTFAGRK